MIIDQNLLNKNWYFIFSGISRNRIQEWINNNEAHCSQNPIFENQEELKPIVAKEPWERIQIDLVSMESRPGVSGDKTYKFIFSILDVFSRFVVLRPLEKKEALLVANELKDVLSIFGNPRIMQCDCVTEFIYHIYTFIIFLP